MAGCRSVVKSLEQVRQPEESLHIKEGRHSWLDPATQPAFLGRRVQGLVGTLMIRVCAAGLVKGLGLVGTNESVLPEGALT